jgi:tetratricopeptide (TPR) repeat protein
MPTQERIERARALLSRQQFAEADALVADRDDPQALFIKAYVNAKRRARDAAIAQLQAAVAQQPDFDEAALHLGIPYCATGSQIGWSAARKHLRQVIANNPRHVFALMAYAEVSWATAQIAEALQALTRIIDLQPTNARAHLMLSLAPSGDTAIANRGAQAASAWDPG